MKAGDVLEELFSRDPLEGILDLAFKVLGEGCDGLAALLLLGGDGRFFGGSILAGGCGEYFSQE